MSTTFRADVSPLDLKRILLTPAQETVVARLLGVAPDDYAPDVAARRIAHLAGEIPGLSAEDQDQIRRAAEVGTTWTFFPAYGLQASLSPETTPPGVAETNLSTFCANELLRALGIGEDDLPCGSMESEEMLERLSQGSFPGLEDAAERLRRVALDAHARDVAVVWG